MTLFIYITILNTAFWMGCQGINDLVERAAAYGMPALAITDHGVMYGAISFYQKCKQEGIKPIIGCEVYICNDRKVPFWT